MNIGELTTAISNTLWVMTVSLPVSLVCGLFLAILLVRTDVYGRRFAWVAISSQLAVPLYVFAGGWSAGFGHQGWLTAVGFRPELFWTAEQLNATGAWLAASLVHALAAIPWNVMILAAGLTRVDRAQEEQALLDGGLLNVGLRTLIPKLRIWMLAAMIWSMVPIMTEMVVTNLYQVPTIAEQVYLDASQGSVRPITYFAGFGLCLLPLALALLLVSRSFPSWQALNFRESQFAAPTLPLRSLKLPASSLLWLLVVGLVALPIASLIAKAGWTPYVSDTGQTSYGWTAARFITTCRESLLLFQAEFFWSSLLAFSASSVALTIALAVTWISIPVVRTATHILMIAMLAVPGPMVGLLVIWLLNRSTPPALGWLYDHTLAAPLLAQQFRLLPLSWILVSVVLAGISKRSWTLANLDGLSRWQRIGAIMLPQAGGKILAIWLLLFVLSFGELSCTILVLPPGVTTVSMRLFEMLHFGMRHQDSGLCGVLILLGWAVAFVLWKTLRDR